MPLQRTLQALTFERSLSRLFATLPWEGVVEPWVRWIDSADPYHEKAAIVRAIDVAGIAASPSDYVHHSVWCAWREARWQATQPSPLPLVVEGERWLEETRGHATLFLSPMTLAMHDALGAVEKLLQGRPVAVFGEDLGQDQRAKLNSFTVVTSGADAKARLREILDRDGVVCTYADFVYTGRRAEPIALFGIDRPISSGFVDLASLPGVMLLPVVLLHDDGCVVVEMEEAYLIPSDGAAGESRQALKSIIQETLERLVRRAGAQWLLLPSLTFESPQMAARDAES